jgi:hypothetical protein
MINRAGSNARPNLKGFQPMHNLHFLLIKADSAAEAASDAEDLIQHWGNEDSWRSIGGIASEDGSDDIENHDDGAWGLSFLDEDEDIPKEGTYFRRAVAYVRQQIAEPLVDLRSTLDRFSDALRNFDPESGLPEQLADIGRQLKHLSEHLYGRRRETRSDIPEVYEWQFDQDGLTDLIGQSEGARRYLVFLDMHS